MSQSSEQPPRRLSQSDEPRTRGWLWRGRPLDFFALLVVVLGTSSVVDLISGTGKSAIGFYLVRTLSILFVGVVVALLAFFRPEALAGKRPISQKPPNRQE
ncbi:MAG TPA: hypothetical protein VF006_15060 [Longimicrobium sp.]